MSLERPPQAKQQEKSPEEEIQKEIAQARDFGSLVETLAKFPGIQGSNQFIDRETLGKDLLLRRWAGPNYSPHITRRLGLREKLDGLLANQPPLMINFAEAEQSIREELSATNTIPDLLNVIRNYGGLISNTQGEFRTHPYVKIHDLIRQAQENKRHNISNDTVYAYLTRAAGLRERAQKILEDDQELPN